MASSSSAAGSERRSKTTYQMSRERLLRYVHDIIKKQNTPLHDIIRDHALPYLPAQSLLRLRSVSTSWNRHISAPFFAHTQSISHRTLSGIFFSSDEEAASYLPFDSSSYSLPDPSLSFIPDTISIISSSNGLLLCRSTTSRYYVCNPATASWTAIPAPTQPAHGCAALLFRPSVLNFDADYSIICSVPKLCAIEVFSSGTGNWRLSSTAGLSELMKDQKGITAAAAAAIVYWQAKNGYFSSYDPAEDGLTDVGPPPAGLTRWQIGEMDGRFCCVGMREGVMEGYELERRGSSWRKKWEVEVAGDPWPLPFEGMGDGVAVWDDGMVMVVEPRSWAVRVVAEGVPMDCTAGVPYISSMVAVRELCYGSHGCFTCSLHTEGAH